VSSDAAETTVAESGSSEAAKRSAGRPAARGARPGAGAKPKKRKR